jgi:hypothetical protein
MLRAARASLDLLRLSMVICLVFASVLTVPVSAQGLTPLVRPDPATLEIGQGQVATLNIVLEDASDVYAIDVRLKFDPTVLEVVDADPAKEGVQAMPGVFPKPDYVARNTVDNQAGTLMYVITQMNPTLPANGRGTVITLQVRGKASGRSSPVTVESVGIADRLGNLLAASTENGAVTVVGAGQPVSTPVGASPPTATPMPTALPATLAPTALPAVSDTPSSIPATVAPPASTQAAPTSAASATTPTASMAPASSTPVSITPTLPQPSTLSPAATVAASRLSAPTPAPAFQPTSTVAAIARAIPTLTEDVGSAGMVEPAPADRPADNSLSVAPLVGLAGALVLLAIYIVLRRSRRLG